jgi:hypothetical protein
MELENGFSAQDPSEVLESGEETFFPALCVGHESASAVVSILCLLFFCVTCIASIVPFHSTAWKIFSISSFKDLDCWSRSQKKDLNFSLL